MKADFMIIGGGVTGLSAAIRLSEAAADVILLEAGDYPSHKICGEFLSPEALPLLERWEIAPAAEVTALKLILPKREWEAALPQAAATLTRYQLDEALAQRARGNGVQIKTCAKVERIDPPKREGHDFQVYLTNGEHYTAPTLLVSTGKLMTTLARKKAPEFRYIGVKAHFDGIACPHELNMHLFPGAYFGVAPIGIDRVNVAGLIACSQKEAEDPRTALSSFLKRTRASSLAKTLESGRCLFKEWMVGPVPEFGIRRHQNLWPSTFFMGDAAGVIPPATGNGLAMGLTSGILAADYALKKQPETYRKQWKSVYAPRISKGILLHRLFLAHYLPKTIPIICQAFPSLYDYVFRATRG